MDGDLKKIYQAEMVVCRGAPSSRYPFDITVLRTFKCGLVCDGVRTFIRQSLDDLETRSDRMAHRAAARSHPSPRARIHRRALASAAARSHPPPRARIRRRALASAAARSHPPPRARTPAMPPIRERADQPLLCPSRRYIYPVVGTASGSCIRSISRRSTE